MNLGRYGKTLIALFTGAAGWAMLVALSPQTAITGPEWLEGGTALAIALGVYTVPGDLFGKATKTVAAAVVGAIGWGWIVLDSAALDITSVEWVTLATILGTAFGVYQVSNAPTSTTPPA